MMVLGDFNDGPGLDEYENLFGRSSIEIVMGQDLVPALGLFDPHGAEFDKELRQALLLGSDHFPVVLDFS